MDHAVEAGDRLQANHTNAPVLTPAASGDFGRAVDTLLRLGRFDEPCCCALIVLRFNTSHRLSTGARGVEACRRAGLPHVLTRHASAAGIAEESINFRLWERLHGQQSLRRRGRPLQTLGLESTGTQSVYVRLTCCASGVDLMRSTCFRAAYTASSCRWLSRMVLDRLSRDRSLDPLQAVAAGQEGVARPLDFARGTGEARRSGTNGARLLILDRGSGSPALPHLLRLLLLRLPL